MFSAHPQSQTPAPHRSSDARPAARPAAATDEIDSSRLLQGQRELVIRHGSQCYRLRHTRNDKLILTK